MALNRQGVCMKSIYFVLILGLFLNPQFSHAGFYPTPEAACSTIDFRTTFPMKVRNQNNLSWCFAHDAADYLQYTFRIPEQISAADIAIAYSETHVSKVMTFFKRIFSRDSRGKPPQTGFIQKAVRKIIPQGYCPESVLPSDYWTRLSTSDQSQSKIGILDAILDLYSLQKKVKSGEIASAQELPWFYVFDNLSKDQFFAILKNTKQRKLLPEMRQIVCQNERVAFPNSPIHTKFSLRTARVFQKINENFDQDMPASIDFYSGIFEDYDHYKRKLDDLHTVLLYGRKYDPETKECVYLMKNSYGEDCKRYDSKIKCESGYLWFPESKLYRTITSSYLIKRL